MQKLLDDLFEHCLENGDFVGANAAVYRDGICLYANSFGMADREAGRVMTPDTIFRIYSMTKPVTAAAALQLMEQGKLHPDLPVSWYLPCFAEMQVSQSDGTTRPAREMLRVQHLLNMTSGLPYAGDSTPAEKSVKAIYEEMTRRQKTDHPMDTLAFCERLSALPLEFEPGTHWKYGTSADLLGGVIQAASGMGFRDYLKQNIFAPLGMEDTDFYVPTEKQERLAAAYTYGETGLVRDDAHYFGLNDLRTKPVFISGGAGLTSTIGDYAKFANALANGGTTKDGIRILGRQAFDYLRTPQVTGEQFRHDQDWDPLRGYSYGCLVRVLTDRYGAGTLASPGEFGWDGWTGTYFCVDPAEKLTILFMIQTACAGTSYAVKMMRNIVYGSL